MVDASFEQLGQHSVTIEVGKAKEQYSVHIDLLCEHSPHFNGALKTKVEGIVPSKLTLPNVRSTTFARFLGWLYFRTGIYKEAHERPCACGRLDCDAYTLRKRPCIDQILSPIYSDEDRRLTVLLAKTGDIWPEYGLYAFAYQYNVPALRQDIVNAAWRHHLMYRTANFADYLYLARFVPADAPLLRLMADSITEGGVDHLKYSCSVGARLLKKLPQELLCKMWLGTADKETKTKNICNYHDHEQDEAAVKECKEARVASRKRKREELDQDSEADVEASGN